MMKIIKISKIVPQKTYKNFKSIPTLQVANPLSVLRLTEVGDLQTIEHGEPW
jgi:hypothetical protein